MPKPPPDPWLAPPSDDDRALVESLGGTVDDDLTAQEPPC